MSRKTDAIKTSETKIHDLTLEEIHAADRLETQLDNETRKELQEIRNRSLPNPAIGQQIRRVSDLSEDDQGALNSTDVDETIFREARLDDRIEAESRTRMRKQIVR